MLEYIHAQRALHIKGTSHYGSKHMRKNLITQRVHHVCPTITTHSSAATTIPDVTVYRCRQCLSHITVRVRPGCHIPGVCTVHEMTSEPASRRRHHKSHYGRRTPHMPTKFTPPRTSSTAKTSRTCVTCDLVLDSVCISPGPEPHNHRLHPGHRPTVSKRTAVRTGFSLIASNFQKHLSITKYERFICHN